MPATATTRSIAPVRQSETATGIARINCTAALIGNRRGRGHGPLLKKNQHTVAAADARITDVATQHVPGPGRWVTAWRPSPILRRAKESRISLRCIQATLPVSGKPRAGDQCPPPAPAEHHPECRK